MRPTEAAELLDEMADLEQLKGDTFRANAYRRAARSVAQAEGTLEEALERGHIEALPGVGEGILRKLQELAATGSIRKLEELRRELPPGLVELTRVPGLGPKRAVLLHRELGIDSLAKLKEAAERGRLLRLRGFGPKSQEDVLRGIAQLEAGARRVLLPEAEHAAQEVMGRLRRHAARLEPAGSLRRRRDTVGDIDLVAVPKGPRDALAGAIAALPGAEVLQRGERKVSVRLATGLQLDVRIVEREEFGAALLYFTGSKQHNIKLRGLALRRGWRLNEYGLFEVPQPGPGAPARGAGSKAGGPGKARGPARAGGEAGGGARGGARGKPGPGAGQGGGAPGQGLPGDADEAPGPGLGRRLAGADEDGVYRKLGLPPVPPELREDLGEVEAALEGRLPRLVEERDLRGDLHTHSRRSDGVLEPEDWVKAAARSGLAYVGLTDHSIGLPGWGLTGPQLLEHKALVEELADRHAGKVRVFVGTEANILKDGSLDLPASVLDQLDYTVAGVHTHFQMGADDMTRRIARALRDGRVDVLSHPTGRKLGQREPLAFDRDEVFEAAADSRACLELDAQPDRLDLSGELARRAREWGCRFAIDSDAHGAPGRHHLRWGVEQARRGWLGKEHVVNTLPAGSVRKALRR